MGELFLTMNSRGLGEEFVRRLRRRVPPHRETFAASHWGSAPDPEVFIPSAHMGGTEDDARV
jgi:hypothetical protein